MCLNVQQRQNNPIARGVGLPKELTIGEKRNQGCCRQPFVIRRAPQGEQVCKERLEWDTTWCVLQTWAHQPDMAFLSLHFCPFLWGSSIAHPTMCPCHRSAPIRNGLTLSGVAFTKDQTPWPHEISPHIFGITARAQPLPGKLDEGLFSLWHIQGSISATALGHQLSLAWP